MLAFLLLFLIGGGLVAAWVWNTVSKANGAKSDLAHFIKEHPESSALVVSTFDENGTFIEDGKAILHNIDQPFVMASTMKIVVLAAYADAIVNGELDPTEQVVLEDWEAYYLPGTDGGAHSEGLKRLELDVTDNGFAKDQTATVSLDDVARIMIHQSGNAATDYLLAWLGQEKIASVMTQIGLEHHTPIRPILGVALALTNHEDPSLESGELQSLVDAIGSGDTRPLDELTEKYLRDPVWRAAQIAYLTSPREEAGAIDLVAQSWPDQLMARELLPKGTAREYARLMALVASGKLLSARVSAIMQRKLEGIPWNWPLRLLFYDRYGSKEGVTAGVLTIASYSEPKRSALAGRARVVVILINQVPYDTWLAAAQHDGNAVLAADLARAVSAFHMLANGEWPRISRRVTAVTRLEVFAGDGAQRTDSDPRVRGHPRPETKKRRCQRTVSAGAEAYGLMGIFER